MKVLLTVVLCFFCFAGSVRAQTATQTVTIIVAPGNTFSVSSERISLTQRGTTNPGWFEVDGEVTYSLMTNGTAMKITASLGAAYASSISLALNLGAPAGTTSAGSTVLTTTAQDLVTGISSLKESAVGITYTASATPAEAPNGAGEAQTVTLTITS